MADKSLSRHGMGRFIKNSNPEQIKLTQEKSQPYEYIGMFKSNMRHGSMGKCFFYNGDFYAGSWKNDMMDSDLNQDGPIQDSILI